MNTVELSEGFTGKAKWTRFADKLKKAMVDDFELDGVTVFLRVLTAEEKDGDEPDVLAFNHLSSVGRGESGRSRPHRLESGGQDRSFSQSLIKKFRPESIHLLSSSIDGFDVNDRT
jgi:hypothetical protein